MAEEITRIRKGNNITMKVRLFDNGEAVSWDSASNITARLRSVEQDTFTQPLDTEVDGSDPGLLIVRWPASRQCYTGLYDLVVGIERNGSAYTTDAHAFALVATSAEAGWTAPASSDGLNVDAEYISLSLAVSSGAGTGGDPVPGGDYLTKTEASETYQTITDETLQTNNKTVVGAINEVKGIAEKGGGSGIPDAPSDGKTYGRNNGAWKEVTGGGSSDAVLYTPQELTDAQQQQARANIAPGGYARPLYEAAGAVYNEETGFYELNGLTDITEEEMAEIYAYSIGTYNSNDLSFCFINAPIRTNLISHFGKGGGGEYFNLSGAFAASKIEVAAITSESLAIFVQAINNAFQNCRNLKKVIGILLLGSISSIATSTFSNCTELTDISLRSLKASITFPDSPNLSKDMILFMIQNSTATSAITITLHPTAFAMASSDADIHQALSEKTFVSLAQAE